MLFTRVIGFCFCFVFAKSGICNDQIAKDFLIERWYETEFIVFEYLPTFSFNESEQLVLKETRQWPSLLMENSDTKSNDVFTDSPALAKLKNSNSFANELFEEITRIDNRCWGYPALPRKDPLRKELLELGITLARIDNFQSSSDKEIDPPITTMDTDEPVEPTKINPLQQNQT
ncbi:MAG: hypothetical protein ACJ0Q3_06520, partial [Candidatus Azotimanducaceae bacterium]